MTKKTTITGHNHAPVGLAGSDNLLTVAAHATVTVSGQQDDAIFTDEGTSDNDILVNGTVTAQKLGSGVALLSDHSSILVGSHGDVSGFNGIASLGNDVTIDNFGTIHTYGSPSADGVAIGSDENNLSSGVLLHNRGTISGLVGVLFYASGSTLRVRPGTLTSDTKPSQHESD